MSVWTALASYLGINTAEPQAIDLGADFETGVATEPAYDPNNAMGAALVFPEVYAAVMRRAASLAALPIVVYREAKGRRERVDEHWLYDLLARPNSYTSGYILRSDLEVDLVLNGNAYTAGLGPGAERFQPLSLVRWQPQRTKVISSRRGPTGYSYDLGDGVQNLPAHRVFHARLPSIRDGADGLFYGVGMVEPLTPVLEAEYHAFKRAKEAMKRGRPDVVLFPKNGRSWTKEQRTAVGSSYNAMTREGGGAIALSEELDLRQLSWSMRDLEGQSLLTFVRECILAGARVPPVAMGLETANFATAREQDRKYWESIQDDARLFDLCLWTEVLHRAGETDLVAETDFSGVAALQAWRTEAVDQASKLWLMGIDRDVALEAVGLSDVVAAQASAPKRPAPAVTTATADPAAAGRGLVSCWFRGYRAPGTTEEDRLATWSEWLQRVHGPAERDLQLAMARALRSQAERVAQKLEEALQKRGARAEGPAVFDLAQMMVDIWDELAERAEIQGIADPAIRDAARSAYGDAVRRMGLGEAVIEWKSADAEDLASQQFARSLSDVDATTRAAVQGILAHGLDDGATVSELQAAIQQASAFAPARALTVARTETTRTAATGAVGAYRHAAAAGVGVGVQKQWMAERDGATRPEHLALDGQTVGIDELFTVPAGNTANGPVNDIFVGQQASGPGGFMSAALVANCRCALLPVLSEAT